MGSLFIYSPSPCIYDFFKSYHRKQLIGILYFSSCLVTGTEEKSLIIFYQNTYNFFYSQTVVQRCSVKEVFLEIL